MESRKSAGEMFFSILLLLVSYVLLLLIPGDESFWGYLVIAVSTLCFIFGFFGIGNLFSNPSSKFGAVLINVIFTLLSIALVAFGIYFMASDHFEFRGTVIFTLLLVEAVFLFMLAKSSVYNEASDGIQVVPALRTPLDELFEAFKDVDTPYGRPWMGRVSAVDGDCMIYGPSKDGSFLFGYYSFGKFFIGEKGGFNSLKEEDVEKHCVDTIIDSGHENEEDAPFYNLVGLLYPAMYRSMFTAYAQTGKAEWKYGSLSEGKGSKVYAFDARFAWFSQIYHLIDEEGNKIYDIKGTAPFKTFKLSDPKTEKEVLMMTKRLLHLFPHYDFYLNGKFYGSMRQRAKILRDEFKMETADGVLKLRGINATIGTHYAVFMDDRLIGTLSEKLNLRVRNIVFDNFTIAVFNDKYLPLLTAMGIMAERELVRDRQGRI